MMQTLITDIELDLQELKYLLQTLDANNNPALRKVALRRIQQMQTNIDSLSAQLSTPQPSPEKEAAGSEPAPKKEIVAGNEPTAEKEAVAGNGNTAEKETAANMENTGGKGTAAGKENTAEKETAKGKKEGEAPALSPILAERIKPATDLRHALSLNDTFRFTRELFKGDAKEMNAAIQHIGEASSLDEAMKRFNALAAHPAEDNEAAADFIELLKKYFQ